MIEWQTAYNELKERYLQQSKVRLGQIEDLLKKVDEACTSQALAQDVMRHFHWLAGSGGIYGFPEVTSLGKEAEKLCERISTQEGQPAAADISTLRSLLDQCREAFKTDRRQHWLELAKPDNQRRPDILLVDSDPHGMERLTRLLSEENVTVLRASSVAEGLKVVEENVPTGLIVHVPLEDGTGYELAERIRLNPGGEDAAVIMISRRRGFLDKVQAIHSGADVCFESSVEDEEVIERLRFLIGRGQPEAYRVLYVEDDPIQAEFVQTVLATAGYNAFVCDNPRKFEEALNTYNPDVILLDVLLPEFSGYELSRYVRQHERYATVPIIFLTTESRIDAKIIAARAGGDDYLVKPVPPALLLSTVAAKLERSRFLKSMLHRDGLTRLLTHTAFMSQAQTVVPRKRRMPERSVAMIIVDIDRFKSINDTYGHPVGDKVIVALSNLLRRRVRGTDIVGRYGGEEFVIILEDLTEQEVEGLANRLLKSFSEIEHEADGVRFRATFSAGVAMLNSVTMDLADWIAAADRALLDAKEAGRNRVVLAPPASVS